MQSKKKALGRGLSAILESPDTDITSRDISGEYVAGAISQIRIDEIESNPFQPRTHFDESDLAELTISIQTQGVIQPITVRKLGYERYQIIAGERRLKATRLAGLKVIPAYIRVANDEQMLEMALVENIHRSELNPLEIAISFQRLIEECHLRQDDLGEKVGKDRSTVSNYLRLLKLPSELQAAIRDNRITMGHARALINVNDVKTQLILLHRILENKLNVRQVEEMVRKHQEGKPEPRPKQPKELPYRFEEAKNHLKDKLQAPVEVRIDSKGRGSIVIPFSSNEDLDQILSKLNT